MENKSEHQEEQMPKEIPFSENYNQTVELHWTNLVRKMSWIQDSIDGGTEWDYISLAQYLVYGIGQQCNMR